MFIFRCVEILTEGKCHEEQFEEADGMGTGTCADER